MRECARRRAGGRAGAWGSWGRATPPPRLGRGGGSNGCTGGAPASPARPAPRGGAESLWERQKREEREVRAQIEQDPFVRSVMATFPGAEILSVRTLPQVEAAEGVAATEPEDDDED